MERGITYRAECVELVRTIEALWVKSFDVELV